MDTLRENSAKAGRARWEKATEEEKKEHALKMAQARWKNHVKKGNGLAVGGKEQVGITARDIQKSTRGKDELENATDIEG